ncbi:hypothetical protein EDC18_10116 [Natranaerovirga pectinivora]|uniref:Uncharacterized protein n=1 Tax=Natranaerovirga pectinivora TaxID=682400 RepID=A0A4R3MNC5_9FIRM|nr:hypothetical protein [Natranaerovirga pectinivora]TCT16721.1 hypothetical protein EDC18_10116 [Natranaerovirga pectinivora]
MAWCPECKTEYEDGVLKCFDCEKELVEDLQDDSLYWMDLVESKKEEEINELKAFLEYSKIEDINVIEDEDQFILQVKKDRFDDARKYVNVYLYNKKLEDKEEEEVEEKIQQPKKLVYEDKNKKVEDLKSSAFAFITVGILGMIFVGLVMLDYISLNMDPTYKNIFFAFFFLVMCVFIGVGIMSYVKVKEAKKTALDFQSEVEAIKSWILSNISFAQMEESIEDESSDEELKYFNRAEYIKERINSQFNDLDETIVDGIVDDLYDEIFDRNN